MTRTAFSIVLLLALVCSTMMLSFVYSKTAICVLVPTKISGLSEIQGTLLITEDDITGHVSINGTITGFPSNSIHGMHVHMFGDISHENGTATGSHFSPHSHSHDNDLSNVMRHAGDMGNVTSDANGVIHVDINKGLLFKLSGNMSVVGRAIIVHERADIGSADPNTGDAGARYAQCVIGIKNEENNEAMADEPEAALQYATCSLLGETDKTIYGLVSFVPSVNETVTISARICGLSDGFHGLHIHTYGDMTGAISQVGGHYNPAGFNHSLPIEFDWENKVGHVGDLGNIESMDGTSSFSGVFMMPKLMGNESIVGRAIVVHSGADNGVVAQPSGGSGMMIARCVIGITENKVNLKNVVCPQLPVASSPVPSPSPSTQPSAAPSVKHYNNLFATFALLVLSVVALL